MLATPSGISRAASLVFSCQCAIPGHRTSRSDYTRGQFRETGSLSTLFSSVETTAKCVSVDLHTEERGYRIQFGSPPPRCNGVNPTLVGPKQALVMEREVDTLLREEAIEVVPPHKKRVRVLKPALHNSQEGWRVASHFRSASVEPLSQQTGVQDAQTGRVSDQVRGLVCHDRSKRRILPYLHLSHSQGVPEVCFRGQSLPISGSSLRPSTLTPHFYKVCGCRVSSVAATRHPPTQLHQ